jgi:hypothetical protein
MKFFFIVFILLFLWRQRLNVSGFVGKFMEEDNIFNQIRINFYKSLQILVEKDVNLKEIKESIKEYKVQEVDKTMYLPLINKIEQYLQNTFPKTLPEIIQYYVLVFKRNKTDINYFMKLGITVRNNKDIYNRAVLYFNNGVIIKIEDPDEKLSKEKLLPNYEYIKDCNVNIDKTVIWSEKDRKNLENIYKKKRKEFDEKRRKGVRDYMCFGFPELKSYKECKSVGGVYDSPCFTNYDCPFYDKEIEKGKCRLSGYCEMPRGVQIRGYTQFEGEPLCECENGSVSSECCFKRLRPKYVF